MERTKNNNQTVNEDFDYQALEFFLSEEEFLTTNEE